MRRRYYFLLFPIILLILAVIAFEPVALPLVKKQLKEKLAADVVTIGRLKLNSFNEIILKDIVIEKKRMYTLKVPSLVITWDGRIFKKEIKRIAVRSAAVDYQKLRVENIDLTAKLAGGELTVYKITGDLFSGHIMGQGLVKLLAVPEYRAKIYFTNMAAVRIVNDFEFGDKVEMTGLIDGEIRAAGRGAELTMLGGAFRTDDPGGTLIIKDRRLLENVVDRAYLDTVVETLQDYDYNAGGLTVTLEENNLIADIQLDGAKGKRNFKVVYHR